MGFEGDDGMFGAESFGDWLGYEGSLRWVATVSLEKGVDRLGLRAASFGVWARHRWVDFYLLSCRVTRDINPQFECCHNLKSFPENCRRDITVVNVL